MADITDYMTVREMADSLGVSTSRCNQIIQEYKLATCKMGHQRLILRSELKRVPKTRKVGRPPGH
jgi:excisionase family DNA binding protein